MWRSFECAGKRAWNYHCIQAGAAGRRCGNVTELPTRRISPLFCQEGQGLAWEEDGLCTHLDLRVWERLRTR